MPTREDAVAKCRELFHSDAGGINEFLNFEREAAFLACFDWMQEEDEIRTQKENDNHYIKYRRHLAKHQNMEILSPIQVDNIMYAMSDLENELLQEEKTVTDKKKVNIRACPHNTRGVIAGTTYIKCFDCGQIVN